MRLGKFKLPNIISAFFVIAIIIIFIFPFFWMCTTSLKTQPETIIFPPRMLPQKFMFENYLKAWNSIPFSMYLKNSFLVNLWIMVIQYAILIPAAFSFARYDFKGKGIMFSIVLLGFMVPQQINFIPIYLMMSKAGLLKSLVPLIIPFSANAFGIFLLRQSFMQTPDELIHAARIDGANTFMVLVRIMMPMSKPALVTVGLLSYISHWNSYFWPLIMTNSQKLRTLPLGVAMLRSTEGATQWQIIMAGNVILVAPILLIYIFANKQIKAAFVYSGIK